MFKKDLLILIANFILLVIMAFTFTGCSISLL